MKHAWIVSLLIGSNLVTFVITLMATRSATNEAAVQTTVESLPLPISRRAQTCCTCAPTSAPTRAPTPTRRPTSRKPTLAPTPSSRPTRAPTPSRKPTVLPTTTPKSVWMPPPRTTWQIQFSGTINTSVNAEMYDLDLFDTSQAMIDQLQANGRKVICYFSAGSHEDWRPDANDFPASVLGSNLDGWPGERWLDVRRLDLLGPIMKARLDLAVTKKCDGVDPDNVDGYTNANGFGFTSSDQLEYNKFLANEAHARGLSIGLKNDLDQIPQLVTYFDWAINEQCLQYNECNLLKPFIDAGKAVFSIEYSGTPSTICPMLNVLDFSSLKKNLNLDAFRVDCLSFA